MFGIKVKFFILRKCSIVSLIIFGWPNELYFCLNELDGWPNEWKVE